MSTVSTKSNVTSVIEATEKINLTVFHNIDIFQDITSWLLLDMRDSNDYNDYHIKEGIIIMTIYYSCQLSSLKFELR